MPVRAFSQPYVDANTGATFSASCLVPIVNVDTVQQIGQIVVQRYASEFTYSLGFKPIQTVATQITGVTYGSVFGAFALQANQTMQATFLNLAITYLGAAPEYSGATAL